MKELIRVLRELMPLLPTDARRFIIVFGLGLSLLSLVEAGALGIFAVVMTQILAGGDLNLPVIGTISQEASLWVLIASAGLMILKSFVGIWMQWISTRKFARFELEIGTHLFNSYIRSPWTERMKRSTAELVRLIDVGIANTIAGVLIPAVTIPSQVLSFVAVLGILVVTQPLTAAITVIYLGLIAGLLYFWLTKKSYQAGRVNRDSAMRMSTLVSEMISALKEITLRDKADEVGDVVFVSRSGAAHSRSNIRFLAAVPKFVIEMALIGGFLLIGTVSFLTGGLENALAAVAIFGIAGFRMIPSLTAVQSMLTLAQSTLPYTSVVMADIKQMESYSDRNENIGRRSIGTEPQTLTLTDVGFTYPGAASPAVSAVNLDIPIGSSLGIVGQSGAGKSTLIDILLGLLTPSAGLMELDGVPLDEVLADWRSRVGYVPQDVAIFDGSIAQNVALTWGEDFDGEKVRQALRRAQLLDTVEARAGGINGRVGERGLALSGGQRQRLGIARALYVDPLVLVLDEATSALDTSTEAAVAAAIRELHGEITVISVAHRLSTIRYSDQVCFMKDGSIVSRGTFDEVVAGNADFAQQAMLAGLTSKE
ncbi:ABC transporter ATP-binding protein [Arthrobacter sp. RIT-PI-e]|uniref:ABC transporter ATP-binding protein n=1 Tax=Arthrobacter sp. RIT-PI-e TaxID=1681197 RepID=UPI000675BB98|nr:ABC transporter ATP-binding protein [Arthrobacter sp. RIT-PI-e]KNC19562.1 ABC transporter ATP-binding protein [Arthrobacter sp. RIT-PI-e]